MPVTLLLSGRTRLRAGGRAGGSITAALFLKEFVKEGVEWAHLDIAGPVSTAEVTGCLQLPGPPPLCILSSGTCIQRGMRPLARMSTCLHNVMLEDGTHLSLALADRW